VRTTGPRTRAARTITAAFVGSALASVGLAVVYALGGHPRLEGALIGVALGALALGFVLWGKRLMPAGPFVEEREPMDEPRVRVVGPGELSSDTPQTPGLWREVAFDGRNPDARTLSAFLSTVQPGAATGAHHHGDQETVLYVLEGTARYRWGDELEHVVEAGPGSFVFIPGEIVHQEINASTEEPTRWVVVRSGVDPIVVNLPELDHLIEQPAIAYADPE
jgi:uncharacterized RmlC-like cupin family protein